MPLIDTGECGSCGHDVLCGLRTHSTFASPSKLNLTQRNLFLVAVGFANVPLSTLLVWILQAVLSRAELLLSSGCCAQPALDAAVTAMEGAVTAWSRVEAEEAEKRAKEAEILKYKLQEHVVSGASVTLITRRVIHVGQLEKAGAPRSRWARNKLHKLFSPCVL